MALLSLALFSVVNTTVEYAPSPLALDLDYAPAPRFAWALTGAAVQSSYQVTVSTADAAAQVVWDSGTVASAATQQIVYGSSNPPAAPLVPEGDYTWTVYVCSGPSNCARSAPALFSAAPSATAWAADAVWIGGFPQLRFNFSLPSGPIARARLYVSGVGLFEAWVNGVRIGAPDGVRAGASVLAPGWSTVPPVRVLAHAFDVRAQLAPGGENVLGVRTGMGKYGYMGVFCTAGPAACNAAVVKLVVTPDCGGGACGNTTILSSTAWLGSDSPIVFDHLFNGETYNASADQPGWAAPGFTPPPGHTWAPVAVVQPNVSALSGWDDPIRIMEDRAPLSVAAGPGTPVVSGGEFVKCATSPDIWWVKNSSGVKNHVDECEPCPGVDACGTYTTVSCAYISGLATGTNFTCAMLPAGNASSYVFDLGRNMAGFCTIALPPTPAGSQVALVHGEILTPAGAVDNTYGTSSPQRTCGVNQGNCADQLDLYYASGSAAGEAYTPTFTFHGFRYVGVFGWPSAAPPPTTAALTCHVVHTDLAAAGGVTTNSSVLNAIQAAIVATQRSNLLSHPSDCPTREKRGWLGDAQVTVEQALMNLDAAALYENWARTLAETATLGCTNPSTTAAASLSPGGEVGRPATYECCGNEQSFGCQPGLTPLNSTGSLPDVVPYEVKPYGGWPGDFVWQVAAEVVPWALLQATGDVPALSRIYPLIQAHLAFISTASRGNKGGLIDFGYYGDWNAASDGASTAFCENLYYVLALQRGSVVAAAVGNARDAIAFAAQGVLVTDAVVAQFFNSARGVWDNGGANAQAMALSVGLGGNATANATASIAAALLASAAANGFHPTCGLASCRHILQGLAIANASAALTMATRVDSPSWGYMVSAGMPGTIWEAWGGDAHTSDGSKNHPMFSGGIGTWLYEDALGLKVAHVPAVSAACSSEEAPFAPLPDETCAAALAILAVQRVGLSALDEGALCRVLADARASCAAQGGCSHAELLAAVDRHRRPCGSGENVQLRTVVSAAPHADVVAELGAAAGWRKVGAGVASVEWQWLATGSLSAATAKAEAALFSLNVTLPAAGVAAADAVLVIGVPLARAAALLLAAPACGSGSFCCPGGAPRTLLVRVSRNGGAAAAWTVHVAGSSSSSDGGGSVAVSAAFPSSPEWLRAAPSLTSPAGVAAVASGAKAVAGPGGGEEGVSVLQILASLPGRYEVWLAAAACT